MSRARMKVLGERKLVFVNVNTEATTVMTDDGEVDLTRTQLDVPIAGTVYGVLLNYKGELEQLGEAVHEKPYNAPPIAPVLYIKPANTFNRYGAPIPLPEEILKLEMGAALGIVIGKQAVSVSEEDALTYIAGYTIVNDVRVPHDNVYRPAVPYHARDGFCPIGPWIVEREEVENPDNLAIRVFVNDQLQQQNTTANLVRPISRLLADITEFMTLSPGDVLLVGVPERRPQVVVGDKIRIEIDSIGSLENIIVAEREIRRRETI